MFPRGILQDEKIQKKINSLYKSSRLAREYSSTISQFGALLVATILDLEAKIAELTDAIEADQASDQAVVDQLTRTIEDLQAQVDSGNSFDFQPYIDQLNTAKEKIVPVKSTPSGETPVEA